MVRRQSQMAERPGAFGGERQKMAEARGQIAPGGPETLSRLPFPQLDAVPGIAGPELIAAVARERDGHAFTRGSRDAVGRNRRGIAERLVEVPRQARQQLVDPGSDQRGLEAAPEMIGNPAGLVELVVRLVGEADRGREHFGVARLRHVGDNGGRIDAAGEEGAERHFADEPHPDRLGQKRVELLEILLLVGRIAAAGELEIPVPGDAHTGPVGDENVARRQLPHLLR